MMKELLKETLQRAYEKAQNEGEYITIVEGMRRKLEKGIIYPGVSLDTFDILKNEVLNESILDPVQKQRPKFVFDDSDVMLPDVKEWIMTKIEEWQRGTNLDFKLGDIHFYGSATGYQYTDTADIDLHAEINLTAAEIDEKKLGRLQHLGTLLDNEKNPISLFLLPTDEPSESTDKYENLYDIKTDQWLKKTPKNEYKIPFNYVLQLSKFFMNAFDLTMSNYKRTKQLLMTYNNLDPEQQEITDKEKKEAVEKALFDFKAAHDEVRLSISIARSFVNEGYSGNEFHTHMFYNEDNDPRMSMNNAIYKMLDKFGYLTSMVDLRKDAKEVLELFEPEKEEE